MAVGGDLRVAREAAGQTVADMAATTRLRASQIERMESDDWSSVGGSVYARGHIRAMAKASGADPAPLLQAYDDEHGAPSAVALTQGFEESTGDPQVRERRGVSWLAAAVGAAALVTALLVVNLVVNRGGGSTSPTTGPVPPVPATTAPASAPTAPSRSAPAPTPGPRPSRSALSAARPPVFVQVKVTGAGGCWVLATSPGKDFGIPQGKVFTKGQTATFGSDQPIKLRLGDAAAVRLTVNGKDLGSPGGRGQVLSTQFDADSGQA